MFKGLKELPLDHNFGFVVSVMASIVQASIWGVRASLGAFAHAIDRDPRLCSCTMGGNVTVVDYERCCDQRHLSSTAAGLACGLGPIFGVIAGHLTAKWGTQVLTMFSAICVAGSLVASTYGDSALLFLVLYGPLMGIGSGFMVTPGAVAAGTRFKRKLNLGMGIVYAGGGIGSAILPRVSGYLLDDMGDEEWRVVQRYLAIATAVCFVAGMFVIERDETFSPSGSPKKKKPNPMTSSKSINADNNAEAGIAGSEDDSTQSRPLWLQQVFSMRYLLSVIPAVFYGYAYYASLFFLVPYARAHGDPSNMAYSHYTRITLGEATSMMLLFGLFQGFGSIALGFVATRVNNYTMNLICCLGSGAVLAALPHAHTVTFIGILASLLGVLSGGARLCFPAMVAEMFMGPALGTMMGVTLMGYGVGALPSPPLSSMLVNHADGNYTSAFSVMAGFVSFSGILAFTAMRKMIPVAEEEQGLLEES